MKSNFVFIVSGGGRGITAQCVIQLAQVYPCNFILLGRSQIEKQPEWADNIAGEIELKKQAFAYFNSQGKKPTPREINQLVKNILATREIQKTLNSINQLGATVTYLSCDITNNIDLSEKLAPIIDEFGQITGIIHGAGVLADKLIENKTTEDFARVYSTKIEGLHNLLNNVNINQLKYLILFSSAAGFYGNIGQSDYAIANEILNKFAYQFKHRYPNCKIISFNWGPWDSGMVTSELKEIFAQRGIEVIPIDVGTKVFAHEIIKDNNEPVQILVGGGLINPLIELDSELKNYRIRRKLTLEANPFLQDHVIGNYAVLPKVFATVWLVNTAQQIYLGYQFFSIENHKLLKGIVFDENLADEYIVELQEINKIPNQEIKLSGKIWSKTKEEKIRYHYQCNCKFLKEIPARPIYENFDDCQDHKLINLKPYEDGTLFHGKSFQGIKRVLNISKKKITIQCILPEIESSTFGQFPPLVFNGLAFDSALQCMLIWVRYFYNAGSLPSFIKKAEYYIPLEKIYYASMDVNFSSNSKAISDLTLHDKKGNIYAIILGLEVTISKQLNNLFNHKI
ncbi:MAG: SDR family NAD(P)-dependent oxidoreductase [Symploca sp. SIO1B1]|nr:SDR family NAD(P)-dependent oxidoreductase [Symploca sp. SIO1B1]